MWDYLRAVCICKDIATLFGPNATPRAPSLFVSKLIQPLLPLPAPGAVSVKTGWLSFKTNREDAPGVACVCGRFVYEWWGVRASVVYVDATCDVRGERCLYCTNYLDLATFDIFSRGSHRGFKPPDHATLKFFVPLGRMRWSRRRQKRHEFP